MNISKWFFKDFKQDIRNLCYLKQIPFICFSDEKDINYDLIGEILDKVQLNRELLVSIGKKQAPFGMTVSPDDKTLNILLNSSIYSIIFTKDIEETDYLLRSVLAGVIPICNMNHPYYKKLGLKNFATLMDFENIIDKLCFIKYNQVIFNRRISLLSWKYRLQYNKWNKK